MNAWMEFRGVGEENKQKDTVNVFLESSARAEAEDV